MRAASLQTSCAPRTPATLYLRTRGAASPSPRRRLLHHPGWRHQRRVRRHEPGVPLQPAPVPAGLPYLPDPADRPRLRLRLVHLQRRRLAAGRRCVRDWRDQIRALHQRRQPLEAGDKHASEPRPSSPLLVYQLSTLVGRPSRTSTPRSRATTRTATRRTCTHVRGKAAAAVPLCFQGCVTRLPVRHPAPL